MCFSPEASFTGGIIISAIGVFTVRKIQQPSQILFACIPLFFGFQQIAEGFVWLTISLPQYILIQKIFVYIFMITAQVVWPVLIPLSVYLMEKTGRNRKIICMFLLMGSILAAYYSFCLIFYHVSPKIEGFHIAYRTDYPNIFAIPATLIYLIATIPPLFISSIKRTNMLAILMTISCIVTIIFFKQYLTSVWCFFAAFISGVIFWILKDLQDVFIVKVPQ